MTNIQNRASSKRAYPEKEAAAYVGLSPFTLRQGRCNSKNKHTTPVPLHINIGRAVRYLREDLDKFLDERRKESIAA